MAAARVRTAISEHSTLFRWLAGAVVVLVAVVVTVLVIGAGSGSETLDADGDPLPTDQAELVRDYLTALQKNDAENAQTYLAESHGSVDMSAKPQFSRHVVTASNYIAPLHDIQIGEGVSTGQNSYDVPASFWIGDREVRRTFRVRTDDHVAIHDGLITVNPTGLDSSGLRVNGRAVSTAST